MLGKHGLWDKVTFYEDAAKVPLIFVPPANDARRPDQSHEGAEMGTFRFAGQTAVVTGAAGGIGRATALRLATEGACVIAVDIKRDELAQTVGLAGEAQRQS